MKKNQRSDYVLSPHYLSRADFLRERCHGKRILHLGCSSGRYLKDRLDRGSLLHGILRDIASDLHGLDIDADSIKEMRAKGFSNLYVGNAESLDTLDLSQTFDVVLAGDLLEHLTCPGAMLDGVKRFLAPGGSFIVSTNNAFGLHFQLRRWTGGYTEQFEHVCFFSPETLVHLFERHGYRIQEMYGAYTEPPFTWRKKIQFIIGKPLFRLFPVLAGTLLVVATPHEVQK